MENKKKFEVIEESRFLESGEMDSTHGGACVYSGPCLDVYTCCSNDNVTHNTCARSKESCNRFWAYPCNWHMLHCEQTITQQYYLCAVNNFVCEGVVPTVPGI